MVCTKGDLQAAVALLEYMTEDTAGLKDVEVADLPSAVAKSAFKKSK